MRGRGFRDTGTLSADFASRPVRTTVDMQSQVSAAGTASRGARRTQAGRPPGDPRPGDRSGQAWPPAAEPVQATHTRRGPPRTVADTLARRSRRTGATIPCPLALCSISHFEFSSGFDMFVLLSSDRSPGGRSEGSERPCRLSAKDILADVLTCCPLFAAGSGWRKGRNGAVYPKNPYPLVCLFLLPIWTG